MSPTGGIIETKIYVYVHIYMCYIFYSYYYPRKIMLCSESHDTHKSKKRDKIRFSTLFISMALQGTLKQNLHQLYQIKGHQEVF